MKTILGWSMLVFVAVVTASVVLGRHHFLLGSADLLRWPAATVGAGLFWRWRSVFLARARFSATCAVILLSDGVWVGTNAADPPAVDGDELRVMTYNLLFRGGRRQVTSAQVCRADVDIIALQEVTPGWHRRLSPMLAARYPHSVSRVHLGTHGLALFSRFPIRRVRYLNNDRGNAFAQCASIALSNRTALVCNVHLASPSYALTSLRRAWPRYRRNVMLRVTQWNELRQLLRARRDSVDQPVLVLGDLNTPDFEPLYRNIRRELVDAGSAPTWPNLLRLPFPVFRIDYVLTGGAVAPIASHVLPAGGSDHLGVVAHLRLG